MLEDDVSGPNVTYQDVKSKVDELPPADLTKVMEYIEFLMYKHQESIESEKSVAEQRTPYRVVTKLGGILKDYRITEQDIAEARKEMSKGFGEIDL